MYVLIFQNDNKPSKPDFCWFLLGNSCTLQYHCLNKNCILEIYFTICQSGLMHSLDSGLFLFCRGWWVKCLRINRLNWKLSKYSSVQCSHSLTHLVLASGWGRKNSPGKTWGGIHSWFPPLSSESSWAHPTSNIPHYLWRSGWLGLFSYFLWLWAQRWLLNWSWSSGFMSIRLKAEQWFLPSISEFQSVLSIPL